jgi:hypothetical protein
MVEVYTGCVPDVIVTVPGGIEGETISTTDVAVPLMVVGMMMVYTG